MKTQNKNKQVFLEALKAVKESNGVFGKKQIIRMLLGWDEKKLKQTPKFFGKLSGVEFRLVNACMNYLFYEDFLKISTKGYGGLMLSETGKSFLEQLEEPNTELLVPDKELFKPRFDFKLYEKLKAYRNSEAEKFGVKPFVLATNLVLERLSADKPMSLEALYRLYYIPKQNPVSFWEKLLQIITEHELNKLIIEAKRKASYGKMQLIKKEVQAGKLLEEISAEHNINKISLAYYIEKLLLSGEIQVQDLRDLSEYQEEYEKIYDYFKNYGDRRLFVGNKLLGFDYDKLRIGRAYYDVQETLKVKA